MSIKLKVTQLAMLSGAAIRDDKCVLLPAALRGALRRKTGKTLIEAGYVREVKAKPSSPIWRNDDATGSSYSLKLTAAGAKAAKESGAAVATPSHQPSRREHGGEDGKPFSAAVRPAPTAAQHHEISASTLKPLVNPPSGAPRAGSKIADVVTLLERDGGATVVEVIAATGWLPHTTRAALTSLRKRGYKIASDRSDRERGSVYRIELGSPETGPEPSNEAAVAP